MIDFRTPFGLYDFIFIFELENKLHSVSLLFPFFFKSAKSCCASGMYKTFISALLCRVRYPGADNKIMLYSNCKICRNYSITIVQYDGPLNLIYYENTKKVSERVQVNKLMFTQPIIAHFGFIITSLSPALSRYDRLPFYMPCSGN